MANKKLDEAQMSKQLAFTPSICFSQPSRPAPASLTRFSILTSLIAALLFTCSAHSQTVWFKHEGNPVLDVGTRGTWDELAAAAPRIIKENSAYHMWYTGLGPNGWRIGYATSRDGIRWAKDPMNPVLRPTASWEENTVWTPDVIQSEPGFKMWFTGWASIGFAVSQDGRRWTKHPRPILTPGPDPWDAAMVTWPAVLGPDSSGRYKMWFQGTPSAGGRFHIGYATATDETTWTKAKNDNPVLSPGDSQSWESTSVQGVAVLRAGRMYEMFYSGTKTDFYHAATGYATSVDGLHWTKSKYNPVLLPGPPGSWDNQAAPAGDVLFDGSVYRMWYSGFDGSRLRTGYAISPAGASLRISPEETYVRPGTRPVRVEVRVNQPSKFSFSATVNIPASGTQQPELYGKEGLSTVGRFELYDDGAHGDSLRGDGVFANNWSPTEESHYFIHLGMQLRGDDRSKFELHNAMTFTTVGPVRVQDVIIVNKTNYQPGDTVVARLVLLNNGASAPAPLVTVLLKPKDPWVSNVDESSYMYGTIPAGGIATTPGTYRFVINPQSPVDVDTRFDVSISSLGVMYWQDSFGFRIEPPWWRSNLAYAFYALAGFAALYAFRKLEAKRTRLRHQRELEQVEAEKLRELDQLKSRFFANISHEFRTPLTLILGPVEKWKDKADDKDLQKDLSMMQRNARRLLRLINQLLDISKLEAGSMKLQASPGNIVSFAKGVAQSFQSVAANKNITLEVMSDSDQIELYFDRDKMEKILSNLLSNAFKFTAEGGTVTLSLRAPRQWGEVPLSDPASSRDSESGTISRNQDEIVEIAITDTGIGIPAEELPHIFDRFYQVDGSHTREQEGTGIGLALVKELVDVHHGTISVKSEVGKGTEFTIQFSLGRAHLKDDEIVKGPEEEETKIAQLETSIVSEGTLETGEERQEAVEGRPIILVVEDNADVRSYIREYLDPTYRVLEARDGDEGVKLAVETVPDLIISDVMMPKKDGYELCRVLRRDEKTSHIPIILLTAKAGTESKIEGLETGADDYLVKPFEAKELLVRVKNLIDLRRKLREKFEKSKILKPGEIAVTSMDDVFLKRAMAVVEQHIGEEGFTVEQFSREMNMSRVQLHRKLTALTNQSARDFVRYLRLHRGMDLLRQDVATVAEVAYSVGFSSPAYFTKCFHEQFGYPPSEVTRQVIPHRPT